MSDDAARTKSVDMARLMESIRQHIVQKMSPMVLPTDASLVLNSTDNGGYIDFWRFAEEDVELSSLLDTFIQQLVSDDVKMANVDGNLMLIPQNDTRVLYLKKLPVSDYPQQLNAISLKVALETYAKENKIAANQTDVIEKVDIVIRKDRQDKVGRFKGTAFVTFKNEGVAHRIYHKHVVKPFKWALNTIKIESCSEYLERKKKTAASYGRDLALVDVLEEELPAEIPRDIAAVFQRDERLRRQTKIDFSDAIDVDSVGVGAQNVPNSPKSVTLEEFRAMSSLRQIVFPGINWSDISGGNSPIYTFEDVFDEATGRFRYRCRVELPFQGTVFVGSSGEIPHHSKKGLTGAKIAAEYDLIVKWSNGKSVFDALDTVKRTQDATIRQKKQYADRNKVIRDLIPPAKRRKLNADKATSEASEPSDLEQLLFFLDAVKSMFPPTTEEVEDASMRPGKLPCNLTLGFWDSGDFMAFATIGTACFEIMDESTKANIKISRYDAEIHLPNILSCLGDIVLLELNVDESSARASMYFSLQRTPKLVSRSSAGKKRISDFYGPNNLWQDTTAIKLDFDRIDATFLETAIPLVENGLLQIITDPSRFRSTKPAIEDWRSWVPSHKLILNPFKQFPFVVGFQLACLITQRLVHRRELNQELVECLSALQGTGHSDDMFSNAYSSLVEYRNQLQNSNTQPILEWLRLWKPKRRPSGPQTAQQNNIFWIPHIVITPTRLICKGIYPEVGNRMLRCFKAASNQMAFLRVSFRDESGKLSKSMSGEIVSDRLKPAFEEGFRTPISGRKYKFLMFSASQLRQHKAWFMWCDSDSTTIPTPDEVRKWVGMLDHIRIPSKFSSRLGLVLSSSTAALRLPNDKITVGLVPDVEGNGYVFSDGIGAVSTTLARKISRAIGISHVPSCFQIRYAGVKGMVAVHPELGSQDLVRFRKSMLKFESGHDIMEVLNWSKPQAAYLNRQVIAVLSGRGIPDDVFLKRQAEHIIDEVELSLGAPRLWPGRYVRGAVAPRVRLLLQHGYDAFNDAYVQASLHAIQFSKVSELKQHCRIPLGPDEGRYLLGALDEYRILKYGQVFISISSDIDDPLSPCRVVTGSVAVSRSPCLHPGDLRVLEAVDVPRLRHLSNCIVFPQQGIRPHPSECSGGDLDGDLYLCIWAPDLVPVGEYRSIPPAPAAPSGIAPVEGDRISVSDIAGFFTHYVQNDYLGALADAWMATTDKSALGVHDPRCLQLAVAHSVAVDFAKNGTQIDPAVLKLMHVQEWPDFMKRDERRTYQSDKVLGKLFRQTISVPKQDWSRIRPSLLPNPTIVVPHSIELEAETRPIFDTYCNRIRNLALTYGLSDFYADLTCHFVIQHEVSPSDDSRDILSEALDLGAAVDAIETDAQRDFAAASQSLVDKGIFSDAILAKQALAAYWFQVAHQSCASDSPVLSFGYIMVDDLCKSKQTIKAPAN